MTNVLHAATATTPSINPTSPAGSDSARVRAQRCAEVLRRVDTGRAVYWALEPYGGCEFGCPFCPSREAGSGDEPGVIEARPNAGEAVARALRQGQLAHAPLVLGSRCEPWQPFEKAAGFTRAALEVLARWGQGVELRAQTRSTLVTRDMDLLREIGRTGQVTVSFSLPTLDYSLARLLEPQVPSPDRRLVAMEVLARAEVRVGVLVAPVIAGINDDASALEALLRRARDSGASYAAVAPLAMADKARRELVRGLERRAPELAQRHARLLSRAAAAPSISLEKLEADFSQACDRVGLVHAWRRRPEQSVQPAAAELRAEAPGARQLEMFAKRQH